MKPKRLKSRVAGILIGSLLASSVSYAGSWQQEAGQWVYQEGTVRATGWLKEPGDSWYHFTPEGIMETGWYQEGQKDRYYLNRASDGIEGKMRTGWFQENGTWYFLNPVHDGFFGRAAADQWLWIDGYCYRFDGNGAMYADCTTPDGYTVNRDGQWTVNGVVQYQEGKGILTKVTGDGGSGSDGSSGGSSGGSGGNRPGGGNNPGGGDQPGGGDNPGSGDNPGGDNPGGDNPGDGDKPGGGNNPGGGDIPGGGDNPGEGDKPSGEGSGSLTIRYMVQDTGEILYEKDVSDKIGELYAIQYPAMDGYKLLPDQRESAYFQKEPQTIPVYYRPIQSGETPDESVVLQDNVKGILSNTAEEKKVVEQIASDFFDINLDNEGNVEWAVYNTNPVYVYIQEGTVQPGDILYIDPCDQFPIGFVFTYESHDDEYTGSYSNYNAGSYEVLHGQKSSVFEMMGPGTSFSFDSDGAQVPVQPAFTWDPWEDKTIMTGQDTARSARSAQRVTVDKKISVPIKYEKELKETEENGNTRASDSGDTGDKDEDKNEGNSKPDTGNGKKKLIFKPSVQGEAYAETNITINIPITKKDPEVYISFKPGFKGKASFDISGEGDVGAKLRKLLSEKTGKEIPKEKKLSLLFMDINVEGVDLSDRLVLMFYGWNIITNLSETNIKNVLSGQVSILEIDKALFFIVPVTVNLKAVIEGEIGPYVDIEFAYPVVYDSKKESDPLTLGPMESKLEAGAGISVSGELDAGLGISAGLAAGGVIPALIDLRLLGIDASGEAEGELTVLPQLGFQGAAEIEGSVYSKIEGRLKLKVSKEKGGLDAAIDVDKVIRPDIGELKNGKITWKEFQFSKASIIPTTLKLNTSTALKAVDEEGNDISSKFSTYNASSKKVQVQYGSTIGSTTGYSFECPRYYMGDDSRIYEITEIVCDMSSNRMNGEVWPLWLNLDLRRVTGLKELYVPRGVVHLELSDHKALKTICTDYNKFACADDCRHDPAPSEIRYDETRIDGWNGKLTGDQDFSGLPNLRTFWVQTGNMSTIDLSKNKNLKHVSIDNSSGPDAANTRLKLPAVNSIETLRVKSGTTLSAPLDLGSFTNLECGSFNMLATTDTALDLSKASRLKHLTIRMSNLTDLDLNPDVSLEYLYLEAVGKINHLDIRNSIFLKEIKRGSGEMNIKSFTGNGLIFPPGRGPWYRDPELTEPVTGNQCGRGETLYRYDYTSGSTRGTVAQKATASNAGLATASNGSAQSSGQSSGYPASGSTLWNQEATGIYGVPKATGSNALLYWEDSFQDTWEDEEMLEELEQELVNDLFQAAALPIPPGTLPLPFKQSRPENRLFYIPEDNRPWRPGQKR